MSIYLGNLNLKDIIKEEYLIEIKEWLKNNRFNKVSNTSMISNKKGNYHIFDIPKMIVICGEEKAKEFVDFITNNSLNKAFKITLNISVVELEKEEK